MNKKITTDGEETVAETATDSSVELEQLKTQLTQAQEQSKRVLADYQNLVRQNERERESFFTLASQTQLVEWLPIVDSLVVAAGHVNDQGLNMVLKQVEQLLERLGVKTINPQASSDFEPELHECIETIPSKDDQQAGKISHTAVRGYAWQDGRVIRHAKVVVWK